MRSGLARERVEVLRLAVIAGHQRHAGPLHQLLGRAFGAHRADRARRRADEDDAGPLAFLGEVLVLRQEAVARMDRLCARTPGDLQDAVRAQIALPGRRRADQVRFVAHTHVQRARVGLGVHRDRADAQALARARHSHRDLAAVGYEDLVEHLPRGNRQGAEDAKESKIWPPRRQDAEKNKRRSAAANPYSPCSRLLTVRGYGE